MPLGVFITTLLSSGLQCFKVELGSQTSQGALQDLQLEQLELNSVCRKLLELHYGFLVDKQTICWELPVVH